MTEPEPTDRWALLASKLGIDLPPREEPAAVPGQPTPGETTAPTGEEVDQASVPIPAGMVAGPPYATERASASLRPAPKPLRTKDEWTQLASSLGVEVPEELAAPAPSEPISEALGALSATAEDPPAISEPAPEGWTESVIELMEAGPEDFGPAGETRTAREGPSQQRSERGRRKRRRRRRSDEPRVAATESLEASSPEIPEAWGEELFPPESTGLAAESPERSEGDEEALSAQPAAPGESPRGGRSRRRRRRRSDRHGEKEPSKGRQIEAGAVQDAPTTIEDAGLEPVAAISDSGEAIRAEPAETPPLDDELDQQPEEGAEEGGKIDKEGHRAIPNWEEAISVIVNRNLEARARKPDAGGPPRSRGRHRGGPERPSGRRR